MVALYNLFIKLYAGFIQLAALFHAKASLWVSGRKNWRNLYAQRIPKKSGKRYWFHCASLGEYEQAKPVMEAIKKNEPNAEIMVTFFSPSGYEYRKNEPIADFVGYLPTDTPQNASDFITMLIPDIVFFVKYEFWYHYISELGKRKIPLYLLSGIFRSDQLFFKWYGGLHRRMLKSFSYFFIQNTESLQLLNKLNHSNAMVSGDTRFDRVARIPHQVAVPEDLKSVCRNQMVIVAGSCWEAEENILAQLYNDAELVDLKYILVPHDISRSRDIQKRFPGSRLYSEGISAEARAIIIDRIGLLSGIYSLGYVNMVGGGFSGALHNILEAAVWSKPVLYGPHTEKFPEAANLVKARGGIYIHTVDEMKKAMLRFMHHPDEYQAACQAAGGFIHNGAGATEKVIAQIQSHS